MEAIHARYPFLTAAREAVETADIDLPSIASDHPNPVINRAVERITTAIADGTIGDAHRSNRVELLSYPLARVLVSLVDEPGLTDQYARAEATTAHERFTADFGATTTLRSVSQTNLTVSDLLAEFNLGATITETSNGYTIAVPHYLRLTSSLESPHWRLVTRRIRNGTVPITQPELYELLREAIRERILRDLPLDVPETIATELDDLTDTIREHLADISLTTDIDTVTPELFPPCMKALIDRLDTTESFPDHSRFALITFLTTIGMPTTDIVDTLTTHADIDESTARHQITRLRDERTNATYPPPSCQTMKAYGDCVNMDALCEEIMHPLIYYERRINNEDTVLTPDI